MRAYCARLSHGRPYRTVSTMATATSYRRSYGVGEPKKDFNLHWTRVAPPVEQSSPPSNYSQMMPGSSHEAEGMLHRGKTSFAMDQPPPGSPPAAEEGKTKSSWTKKMRGLFKSSPSGKKGSRGPRSAGSSPAHPSSQERSRSATWTGSEAVDRPPRNLGGQEGVLGRAEASGGLFKGLDEGPGHASGAAGTYAPGIAAPPTSTHYDQTSYPPYGNADPPMASVLIRLTLLPNTSTDGRSICLLDSSRTSKVHETMLVQILRTMIFKNSISQTF